MTPCSIIHGIYWVVGNAKKRQMLSCESATGKRSSLQQRSYTMAKKTKKKAKAKKKK
jgi:hypothetical protein